MSRCGCTKCGGGSSHLRQTPPRNPCNPWFHPSGICVIREILVPPSSPLRLRYNAQVKTERQQVIELIERMPDQVSTETIITELQFRLTMMRRGEEAGRGENLITHDEAKTRLGKWLNSPGT